MKNLLSRYLAPVTLLEWGGVLLYFYLSGRLTSFLHPIFRPQVLAAGILLILCGLILLLTEKQKSAYDLLAVENAEPARLRVRKTWLYPTMLLVPLAIAAFFTNDAFGANILATRGVADTAAALPGMSEKYKKTLLPLIANAPAKSKVTSVEPALPGVDSGADTSASNPSAIQDDSATDFFKPNTRGNIELNVADLLYAAEEPTLQNPFLGKSAEIVGQFMPAKTNNANGKRFKLVRLFMNCCAADAQPISLLIETSQPLPPNVTDMAWVRVTGEVTFPLENGRVMAVLQSDKVEAVDPPEESMLY